MAALPSSKLFCLFTAGTVLCTGQPARTTAMHWVDYYAGVCRVPPEFVDAIIEVESAWQPHAISTKGAAGLMQLMPATAATFGVTNRFEMEQNIRGGVAYLAYLSKMFRGDLRLVTAAYLAGESRILSAGLQYSNAEVFEYVSKVARLYQQKRLKRLRTKPVVDSPNQGGNSP
jgi:soluble lytic murein transglycosylase-like protein